MLDRVVEVQRPLPVQPEDAPVALLPRPVKRRLPAFALDRGPAFGQPKFRPAVPVGRHELEIVPARYRLGRDAASMEIVAVARPLVIESEAPFAGASFIDPGRQLHPTRLARRMAAQLRICLIGGTDRIEPECVLDIRQQQLLVLLLVLQAKLDQFARILRQVRAFEQRRHRLVDMRAIPADRVGGRPGQHAALGPRMTRSGRLVIRIEQIAESGIERCVSGLPGQYEGLEEPGRMGAMPFGGAAIRHRLDLLILGRQRFRARLGLRAHGEITVEQAARREVERPVQTDFRVHATIPYRGDNERFGRRTASGCLSSAIREPPVQGGIGE